VGRGGVCCAARGLSDEGTDVAQTLVWRRSLASTRGTGSPTRTGFGGGPRCAVRVRALATCRGSLSRAAGPQGGGLWACVSASPTGVTKYKEL